VADFKVRVRACVRACVRVCVYVCVCVRVREWPYWARWWETLEVPARHASKEARLDQRVRVA
jgi:hypothetical protein